MLNMTKKKPSKEVQVAERREALLAQAQSLMDGKSTGVVPVLQRPSPMERHGGLQPIRPAIMPRQTASVLRSSSDIYAEREKERLMPSRVFASDKRPAPQRACPSNTNAVGFVPARPNHLSAARLRADTLPSRRFDKLHYPDGRITDLHGNPCHE